MKKTKYDFQFFTRNNRTDWFAKRVNVSHVMFLGVYLQWQYNNSVPYVTMNSNVELARERIRFYAVLRPRWKPRTDSDYCFQKRKSVCFRYRSSSDRRFWQSMTERRGIVRGVSGTTDRSPFAQTDRVASRKSETTSSRLQVAVRFDGGGRFDYDNNDIRHRWFDDERIAVCVCV